MKIGIISDTHGCAESWKKAVEGPFKNIDIILHAGDVLYHGPRNPILPGYNPSLLARMINECDKPILFARGNCDADVDQLVLNYPMQSPYHMVYIEGIKILVTHGESLIADDMVKRAKLYKINILIHGHTHIPYIEKKDGIIILNPGSPSLPKGEEIPTVGLIEDNNIRIVNIDTGEIILKETF